MKQSGPIRRAAWATAGHLALGAGAAGVVLPVLPTTPFVLLAAFCYARGSRRAHVWLLKNRTFGPMIRRWRRTRTVSLRAKAMAIALVVLMLGGTIVFAIEATWLRAVLAGIGVAVIALVASLRTTAVGGAREARLNGCESQV